MFTTKLRALRDYPDWAQEYGNEDANALMAAFDLGQQVQVIGLSMGATPGLKPDHQYYDIQLADGTQINAISGIHLLDIDQYKLKHGVQFSLELVVEDGTAAVLDHNEMVRQLTFAIERAMINFGYKGKKTTVGLVQYQTSYDIPA